MKVWHGFGTGGGATDSPAQPVIWLHVDKFNQHGARTQALVASRDQANSAVLTIWPTAELGWLDPDGSITVGHQSWEQVGGSGREVDPCGP
jgi:hypothetical protein